MDVSKSIEPVTRAFIEKLQKLGGKPLYEMTPTEARKVLLTVQDVQVAQPAVDIDEKTIPVGPKGSVSITIFKPKGSTEILPAVMFFHGGGWVLGDKKTHERFVRDLAVAANAAIVFVNYTSAPEAQYPTQIEEAYAATKYIAENGKSLKLDTSKLALVGDSVGGNMVLAVALLAKERGGPRISFQILFYPVTDANFETPSYKEFAEGPWLTKAAMKWFWKNYLSDEMKRKEPTASPLQASIEQLKGLAPTLIMTNEFDVLRDEGEAMAHKLTEAGVTVIALRHCSTIHDSALLNPIATTPACVNSIETAAGCLRKLYGRDKLNKATTKEANQAEA